MAGEWFETTIGAQATLQRGIDITKAQQRPGEIPVVSSGGIASWHDSAPVSGPGVVLGRKGVVGSVYFVLQDYWPHDTTLYVKDFHGNDERFVYYFFRSQAALLATMDVGSANPTLNRNHVHPIAVSWPVRPVQERIANILGSLDDKIELNRRMNETLEEMARALFKSWFVDFDPVRAKAAGRKPSGMDAETAKLFPSEFEESELGEIPKGWRRVPLGELVSLTRGTTYKSKLKGLPGPVLLGLASIARNGGFRDDKLVSYGGESPTKLVLQPGDLFASLKDVTQSADLLGAVARVPGHVRAGRLTQDTVKLSVTSHEPIDEILLRSLLHPSYREYCRAHATGTTNLGLPREDFLAYPILLPTPGVLSRFNQVVRELNARAESTVMESRTLAELRDALLPKLLSGELSVKNAERILEATA